ncbi:hypothetical protein [Microbacterium sediminis]|uniref:Uncharacterized protein n=1 Tax=Microbacterium sediminis TaxID=904291 RepID=A0A1B9NF43_9MICO|nr:hypothetical protein [Microbacterium sediminis]OCG75225.1 hypothetical protein A7J15_02125 [Microbacterium sediminis]QBR74241.1 hypothetical protein E3O41_07370 [Microbacterium sediminis]
MSTPEQPLTRRQLKEMRRTGALPVVDAEKAQAPAEQPAPVGAPAAGSAESRLGGLPKAAPVVPAPAADERAEATPQPARDEKPAAPASEKKPAEPVSDEKPAEPAREEAPKPVPSPAPAAAPVAPTPPLTRRQARVLRTNEIAVTEAPEEGRSAPSEPKPEAPAPARDAAPAARPAPAPEAPKPAETAVRLPAGFTDAMSTPEATAAREDEPEERPKVGASFGAAVFQQAEERQRQERERAEREAQQRREATATATATPAQPQVEGELFAEAFQRSLDAGGSTTATGTSLVLHDMPGTGSLSGPMTATGEFMITSSHVLPAGLASRGAATGTTDGKDVDATLMDGEIPLHSSPTPIAASSAVSTSKAPGDVIRPPQPDKNHGLMLTLGIVAGVLGVGLAGVLIYAFATGVFG